jgi:hypothetical protein
MLAAGYLCSHRSLWFGAQRFGLIIVYLGRHQRSRAIEILEQAQLRIVLHLTPLLA